MTRSAWWLGLLVGATPLQAAPITTVEALVAAVAEAESESTIELAAGTFRLAEPLVLKGGTRLIGQGIGKTILTGVESWRGDPKSLPDPETHPQTFDKRAYLIHLPNDVNDFEIARLTLTGPQLHGAIYGWFNQRVQLHALEFRDFQYAGVRTYGTRLSRIHDCVFVDAGQRWSDGKPGVDGGITGGGIFAIWIADTEISHNRFRITKHAPNEHYYGIKGRQGRRLRIHHNTIETNFSIEFPFEGDEDVEIDHNVLAGTVSIPKYAGGHVPESGRTFHLHHNLFRDSYAIEFVRNGVEIDHNLFDFDPRHDHGNLISAFGDVAAPGPCLFHNNLVANPGRGVMWMNEPYGQLTVRHNHIIARPTRENRADGLFGFHEGCDFKTFRFEHNLIECRDRERPLFRNDASGRSTLLNNRLIGISDADRYTNPPATATAGLEAPLKFSCGVHDETVVDGWLVTTAVPKP